ncbi:MAG TPA: hypothetical protein V6C57_29345 [Coleofasciculaceae cyanobacterium]
MSLQELQDQVFKLPIADRLALANLLIQSVQQELKPKPDRAALIDQMRGLLKTEQPAPTDEQVAAMLEERRVEKFLQ